MDDKAVITRMSIMLKDCVKTIEFMLPYVQARAKENGNCLMLSGNAIELGKEAGVVRDVCAISVRIGYVSSVTALVSRRPGETGPWGPAPWPVAFAVAAVANWALRSDPKRGDA